MAGMTDSTPRPNQHRISNSISALRGKKQLDEDPISLGGTARAMGHQSRLVGHSVGHGQYLRCILARFSRVRGMQFPNHDCSRCRNARESRVRSPILRGDRAGTDRGSAATSGRRRTAVNWTC
jgi:hypothetical protein